MGVLHEFGEVGDMNQVTETLNMRALREVQDTGGKRNMCKMNENAELDDIE